MDGTTMRLAHWVCATRDLPEDVRLAAERTVLNWLGCTLGGAGHPAVEAAVAAFAPFAGPGQATLPGRAARMDILHAALVNGIASHVLDFDDTHAETLVHPGGPVVSAAFALAEHLGAGGPALLRAVALGVDVACRVGAAVLPGHYDVGWHITGTAGVFGAAAAAAALLGLDAERTAWALGLAATQPVGVREMFGSMAKSFHPGRAAQNGLSAALLAQAGFTSSPAGIEGARGWARVMGEAGDLASITADLGTRWEIRRNTFKPFACGLVIHPALDGCIRLRAEGLDPADVASVRLDVHPLVLELTGKTEPRTGLEGKFSVFHGAAIALLTGRGGEAEFSDAAVNDAAAVALRRRVTATVTPGIAVDAADLHVTLHDGRGLRCRVEHAVGSAAHPMTDAALDAKFTALAATALPADRCAALLSAVRGIGTCADVGAVARLATPPA